MKNQSELTKKDTAEIQELKTNADHVRTLSEFYETSFIYKIAKANIDVRGFYACTFKGVKTFITQ